MELTFERLEGRSNQYYMLLAVFATLAVGGLIATVIVSNKGIYMTGMTNRVPWGLQIVMAVYYIGLSAGSLVISGLYGVFGKLEYKPFARIAVYIAMLFLIAGLLSILTDQGRLDRVFVEPFVHFNLQSMFSINPILYIGHILICVIYLWALFTERKTLTKVIATLAFGWAFCVHTGTGAIFGFGARVLYESPLLPAAFVAAAMASGTALMILVIVGLFKVTKRHVDDGLIIWLGRFLAICVIIVMYFLFVENAYRAYVVELREAAFYYLFGGFHSVLFWFGLILVGCVAPLVILFRRRTGESVRWIVLASTLVVFGVLCERYVIVLPGLTNPPELIAGMEITHSMLEEGVASYAVSIAEVVQALGVFGVIGFLFVWGLKIFKLLPTEARMLGSPQQLNERFGPPMLQRIPVVWKLFAASIIILLLVLAISNYSNNLVVITITIVLGCGCTWVIVYNHFKRLIRELVNGMNRLAEKEFDFQLDEDKEDTFESLSSFNDMASMLASSMNELKKNQDYLRSILESSADLIITLNSSGRIQTINSSAENVLGHDRNDVIGQSIEIILADPHDRKVAARKLEFAENVVDYETQFITKNKEIRDVSLTLSRLRSPAGTVIGTIVLGKDITDEKHLQNEIIQSQPYVEIGQVFTGIQHSMKNMLNACKGGAYMVRTGLTNDNRKMLEEGWDMVEEGISKLTNMSSNMLKYVKEWKARCSTVDLGQILIDIHHVCKQNAVDNNVDFQLNISPELPPVFCDGHMIHSVVMDIVSNAFDACLWKDYEQGTVPKIEIGASAYPERQEVVIEIKDNGCGMTNDVKENIFVPFFSTKSRAGTGLGLSIASRMIAVHGGKIDVESEANVGTVFHISLPIDGSGANKEHTNGEKGSGR